MHVLTVGGAGYVGSIVSAHLLEAGHRVTVLDDLSTGHRDAVAHGTALPVRRHDPDLPEGLERLGQSSDPRGLDAVVVAYQNFHGSCQQAPGPY